MSEKFKKMASYVFITLNFWLLCYAVGGVAVATHKVASALHQIGYNM